jgi:hypothetical protein
MAFISIAEATGEGHRDHALAIAAPTLYWRAVTKKRKRAIGMAGIAPKGGLTVGIEARLVGEPPDGWVS